CAASGSRSATEAPRPMTLATWAAASRASRPVGPSSAAVASTLDRSLAAMGAVYSMSVGPRAGPGSRTTASTRRALAWNRSLLNDLVEGLALEHAGAEHGARRGARQGRDDEQADGEVGHQREQGHGEQDAEHAADEHPRARAEDQPE